MFARRIGSFTLPDAQQRVKRVSKRAHNVGGGAPEAVLGGTAEGAGESGVRAMRTLSEG